MLYVSLDLKSKHLLVDKTELDEPQVDEIVVDEPGPNPQDSARYMPHRQKSKITLSCVF